MSLPAWVLLSRARLAALDPSPPPPDPAPAPFAARREVTLREDGDAVQVVARWTFFVAGPAEVRWALAGPEVAVAAVTLDGAPVALTDGALALHVERPVTVELRGTVARAADGAAFALLPAGAGAILHPVGTRVEGAVPLGAGRSAGGAAALRLVAAPAASGPRDLVLAETALGVSVGDAETTARAVVRYQVFGAPIGAVAFRAPAAADLAVSGPQVARWARDGDRVVVELRAPERALVQLDVQWSSPTPRAETSVAPLPALVPEGVFRTTATVQVARDAEIDVAAEVPGAAAVPTRALPEWARNLAVGLPVGAWSGGAGALTVHRFTPASRPPTLIDVANHELLVTDEGRVLLRARYAVRNDRGAALRVTTPAGLVPIGATVSGRPATVARDGDAWLVPLEKSVETVDGLLSFPVEVLFVGALDLDLRDAAIPLPAVDAEVAVARATVHLPRDRASRLRIGADGIVADFTAGDSVTYGYAVGDLRGLQADVLFQEAVDAWKENDFRAAGGKLAALQQMGARGEDLDRLQSNLDLLETGAETSEGRRVLDQAKARSLDDALAQEEALDEADSAYAAGDYDRAEGAYERALDLGDTLQAIAGDDQDQDVVNALAKEKLDETRAARDRKSGATEKAKAPAYRERTEIDFEGVEVTGELVAPQGALLLDRTRAELPPLVANQRPSTFDDGVPDTGVFEDEPAPEQPGVTAAALGLVWPSAGEVVRYQRLLLPAGAAWTIRVRAHHRSNRRS